MSTGIYYPVASRRSFVHLATGLSDGQRTIKTLCGGRVKVQRVWSPEAGPLFQNRGKDADWGQPGGVCESCRQRQALLAVGTPPGHGLSLMAHRTVS